MNRFLQLGLVDDGGVDGRVWPLQRVVQVLGLLPGRAGVQAARVPAVGRGRRVQPRRACKLQRRER